MHPAFRIHCRRCGSDLAPAAECPNCGNLLDDAIQALRRELPVVSIKAADRSQPELCDELLTLIDSAQRLRLHGLVLIHGYGSGGQGGRLRQQTRARLDELQRQGTIRAWYPGEAIGRDGRVAASGRRPEGGRLRRHAGNDGVSVVLL